MSNKRTDSQANIDIQNLSVIDLVLIDHRSIKECIEILLSDDSNKRKKMAAGKKILEVFSLHSLSEKKAIYTPLKSNEELHFNILEAEVEHGVIDQKIKSLRIKLRTTSSYKDEIAAEFKVLSELIKHHLMEEESEVLPKMKECIDDETLNEMGRSFMKLRKFGPKDLQDYPQIQDELIEWKDSIQKVSSEFLVKMTKFVENMQH